MTTTTKKSILGFTLIELLIAISIVAILSSIGLASLSRANRSARDSQRRSDIESIRGALEEYYASNNNNDYPSGSLAVMSSILESGGFIGDVPEDPTPSQTYTYNGGGQTYCIAADLEAPPSPNPDAGTCLGGHTYVKKQND